MYANVRFNQSAEKKMGNKQNLLYVKFAILFMLYLFSITMQQGKKHNAMKNKT